VVERSAGPAGGWSSRPGGGRAEKCRDKAAKRAIFQELTNGEQGYPGQEYLHGMGGNTYYARPWHLPEYTHPTTWATTQMTRFMKRKDPCRPALFYVSYVFPHPPMVPLPAYWDMHGDVKLSPVVRGDWLDDSFIMRSMTEMRAGYTDREADLARRAFHAQCTHIDHQIRPLIGTLRECNLLDDTVIVFLSDHGDMLFEHDMVAKRCFYENAANIPFIVSGKPVAKRRGMVDRRLGCLADVMPTLLDVCGLDAPGQVEGKSLLRGAGRETLYCEVGEGQKASRMIRDERHKLIYYPRGNVFQLFDLAGDPRESRNLAHDPKLAGVRDRLERLLVGNLYGRDLEWIRDGRLAGLPAPEYSPKADYGLYNQRGLHWPAPSGYTNLGKNA
jgi:arylsulfatase A-like enzyme